MDDAVLEAKERQIFQRVLTSEPGGGVEEFTSSIFAEVSTVSTVPASTSACSALAAGEPSQLPNCT